MSINMNYPLHQPTDFEEATQQLLHDLASPLTIMQLNIGFVKNILPKDNLLMMQSAVNQIRDITYSALNKQNASVKIDLIPLAEKIVSEKLYVWKNHSLDTILTLSKTIQNAYVFACATDIYRMLSNLLNNAYESLQKNREIILNIIEERNHIVLSIVDSGCGIPKNKINSVLHGESLKKDGHGLGLSSAFKYMQSIRGYLMLQSEENKGTEVRLVFPKG